MLPKFKFSPHIQTLRIIRKHATNYTQKGLRIIQLMTPKCKNVRSIKGSGGVAVVAMLHVRSGRNPKQTILPKQTERQDGTASQHACLPSIGVLGSGLLANTTSTYSSCSLSKDAFRPTK